jgi:hypothetical protein
MSKREDINLQHLTQFVEQKFPKNIFNVKITGGGNDVEVDIEDKIGDDCISFYVRKEDIIINNLYKCQIRGTVSLLNVEQIAIQMGIFKIMLSDGSHITTSCGIKLRLDVLFILSSGITWYNKLGYDFENQLERNTHNNQIILKSMDEFIQTINDRLNEPKKAEFNELITSMKKWIRFDSNVKGFFIDAIQILKTSSICEFERHLEILLNYIVDANLLIATRGYVTKIIIVSGRIKKRKSRRHYYRPNLKKRRTRTLKKE